MHMHMQGSCLALGHQTFKVLYNSLCICVIVMLHVSGHPVAGHCMTIRTAWCLPYCYSMLTALAWSQVAFRVHMGLVAVTQSNAYRCVSSAHGRQGKLLPNLPWAEMTQK